MRMALRLAARARGGTYPNPMVGAVVVRSGRVVGRGFHRRAGRPHAEALALRQAGARAAGGTLYVSLEPCAHTGRTPPCVDAIRRAGIRRVAAAMVDPHPRNRGRGLRWLRARGIRAGAGLLEAEARALVRPFAVRVTRRRPFVTVKVAQSLDGKIATATGESRWISGPQARGWAHRLRAEADAILVGVETVLKDDPRLTVRRAGRAARGLSNGAAPMRVILDSRLRTPPAARIFSSHAPVVIAAGRGAPAGRERALRRAGAEVARFPTERGRVSMKALLRWLAGREVTRLLIEGGGEVIASAFAAGAVDRVQWVISPRVIGGRKAPTSVEGKGALSLRQGVPLHNMRVRRLGADLLVTADAQS